MSKRLFGGFVLVVVVLLALGTRASAQRKTPAGVDSVVPLNFNSNSLSTPSLFVDPAGNRVCGLLTTSPVTLNCEALPITIPAGAPVVALNPFDTNLHYFVVGTGVGATQFCVVTSSPTVGTTVCSTSPF
jgi:hypothetical protein